MNTQVKFDISHEDQLFKCQKIFIFCRHGFLTQNKPQRVYNCSRYIQKSEKRVINTENKSRRIYTVNGINR